jgi:hypothetical protein
MDKNEEQFESFIALIKLDDFPDPGHRDRLEKKLLYALDQTAQRKHSYSMVWRTILDNKITKVVTAAVIILAIIIGIVELGQPVGASVTFAAAMDNI